MFDQTCLRKSTKIILLSVAVWLLPAATGPARAEETVASEPTIEPVVVVGTVESSLTGKSSFDRQQIGALPSVNANVEDVIKAVPGVQVSDQSNSSLQGGEIAPPLISISGGRPYDNNVRIDGIGNNSLLDPGSDIPPNSPVDVPGHPETIFLNSRLIGRVDVYDNNIPVRFGGFSGGVIDIRTIDPSSEFEGSVQYRTTRDDWTEFHVDASERTAFENSYTESRQPRFEKHDTGFDVHLPVSENAGFLLSYQWVYSLIPLQHFGRTEEQSRRSENVLLKYVNHVSANRKLTLQGLYNPYEGEYFLDRTRNSRYSIRGGGTQVGAEYEQTFGEGHLLINGGLNISENSRRAPADHRNWALTASKDWGATVGLSSSREGGFGDIDKTQTSIESSLDWLSDTVDVGTSRHQINAGLQVALTSGRFRRKNTSYAYKDAQVAPGDFDPATFTCGTDAYACDPTAGSEQYLSERSVYRKIDVTADILQLAVYLDDTIVLDRLEVRPGVRVTYDDFMENTDLAPRLSLKYDMFEDGRTELIGGWNRYYTRTVLTYKLREAIIPSVQERTTVVDNDSEWAEKALVWPNEYAYSGLKTPFSDEIVLGVNQALWGGRLDVRYVRRDGDDEFAREKDPFDFSNLNATLFSRLNNNGESHYESYRLSWERQWPDQSLSLGATYSESTSTNASYEEIVEPSDFDPDDRIWFDGELLWPDELPRRDFNRSWVATLTYAVDLPMGLTFTNVTRYRSGYRDIDDTGTTINIDGVDHDVYAEFKRSDSTIFDWKIGWTPQNVPEQALSFSLEILNLFNERTNVGPEADEYELGRQFWLGAEYRF